MTIKNVLIVCLIITIFHTYTSKSQTRIERTINYGKGSFSGKGLLKLNGVELKENYKIQTSNKWFTDNYQDLRTILNIYMNTPSLIPSLTYKINKEKKEIIISIHSPHPYSGREKPNLKAWNDYFEKEFKNYLNYKNQR